MEGFGDLNLRWLLESVPDAVVLVDAEGRIVGANATTLSLFGYAGEDELTGQGIEILVPERLRNEHLRWRQDRGDVPYDRPMGTGLGIVARRRDGAEFRVDIQLRTREMPTGPITVAVVRDLTERSRVRELSDLLHSIRTAASTLVARLDPREAEHGLALEICEAVERAIELENASDEEGGEPPG